MTFEKCNAADVSAASLVANGQVSDAVVIHGVFTMEHIRDGVVIYREEFQNTVCTIGKNVMLDAALAGTSYTVVGPFMGLISSTSYTAIAAADTMASHAGWLEAGNANTPAYSGNRKTAVWSAASAGAKALSAALNFTFTGSGTVKGAFLTYFTGSVSTIDSTAGTLFSAGLFSGGDRAVLSTDQINVSYSVSL